MGIILIFSLNRSKNHDGLMKKNKPYLFLTATLIFLLLACNTEEESPVSSMTDCATSDFFCEFESRNFQMGFTTWPYAPSDESVNNTYQFLGDNADIYSEHIDSEIPWDAWINDSTLPVEFTNDIASRASRVIPGVKLTVSVSLLNSSRSELASDFDGTTPNYSELNDAHIEDAYFKHLKYITNQLNPDFLIIAIEVNELLKNAPDKWEAYKLLMANIKSRVKQEFPSLSISESITLHNFYQPDVQNPSAFIEEVAEYANSMDYATISFYPFFKGFKTKDDFQKAFDFLHEQINKPIAIAETGHLSEDLSVESLDLFISGNQSEQKDYLESLITNAQNHNYEYVIWWTHRDYDELWETFPDAVKDLGKLWISTGIINEDGADKEAFATWNFVFNK